MSQNTNEWAPPVSFYFQVKFYLTGGEIIASFLEVDGLDQEFDVNEQRRQGDTTIFNLQGVRYGNLTLKRTLAPLDDSISKWVSECFNFPYTCKIKPCRIIISLMNEQGASIAAWECHRAIPLKWSLAQLKGDESKISVETLTLKHSFLGRIV